jgi:HSP90 family molecular chaperone
LKNRTYCFFAGVSDALAEFVDNSIQACQKRKEKEKRDIQVSLDLNYLVNKDSYITICDNGQGMTVEDLTHFATYSFTREARGYAPSAATTSNASNISKFGVGAKQGGFFLGDRIHVITKSDASEDVLEISLDEQNFNDRFLKEEDVSLSLSSLTSSGPISLHTAALFPRDTLNRISYDWS